MIKMFFLIFFILELIIFCALILKIYKLTIVIKLLNKNILSFQNILTTEIIMTKRILSKLRNAILNLKKIIEEKRRKTLLWSVKSFFLYSLILISKGKYRKIILSYQIGKEIYNAIKENEEQRTY